MDYASADYSRAVSKMSFTRFLEQGFIDWMAGSERVQMASNRVHDRLPEPPVAGYIFNAGEAITPLYHFDRAPLFLEIGCNDARFLSEMQLRIGSWANVGGIDVNPMHPEVTYMDVTDMGAIETASVDWVLAKQVLEHVENLPKGLEEILRVTHPGGIIAFTYPSELIRGISALPTALLAYHNPFKARSLHVNKLNPSTVNGLLDSSYVEDSYGKFAWTPQPTWGQVLVRNEKAFDSEDYVVGR